MSLQNSNRLLDALPASERTALQPHLERVTIPAGAILFHAERVPRYAYMLTSGVASILSQMTSGLGVEVGMIGKEGIPGSARLLDGQVGHTRCVMQEAGTAYRVEFRRFEQAFHEMPGLHKRVLQHVQFHTYMTEQMSACNRVHSAEERVARWLLMATDRVGDLLMSLTQESLAEMLGTRRTTITLVAGSLQKAGLIRYRRGRMQILNGPGLQEIACECYPVTQRALRCLYDDQPATEAATPAAPPLQWRPTAPAAQPTAQMNSRIA